MTQTTKIWIWISVAVLVIAGIFVGGFLLIKKDNNDDNNGGGENADYTPNGNGSSNKNNSSNNSSGNDSETNDFDAEEYAAKLKKAIYGVGTDTDAINAVFDLLTTQEKLDLVLSEYKNLTGTDLYKDINAEFLGYSIRKDIQKRLNQYGLTMTLY